MRPPYQAFYVIQPGDTVSGIFASLYSISPHDFGHYRTAIEANNPHIANLDRLRSGQMLDVALQSHDPSLAIHRRTDLEELERVYQTLSPDQKQLACHSPHVLTVLRNYVVEPAVNFADAGAFTLGKLVKQYTDASRSYGAALARNIAENGRGTLSTELTNMVTLRKPVQEALDRIPQFVQQQLLEEAKRVPAPMRFNSTGVAKEILRLAPEEMASYNPFSRVLAKYARITSYAGYAGVAFSVAIPIGFAAWDSFNASGTDQFGRVSAKGAGSVLGGLGGSAVGFIACNLVFGGPTAGTSLFWCSVAVGGVAGMLMSAGVGEKAEQAYDKYTGSGPPEVSEACAVPQL